MGHYRGQIKAPDRLGMNPSIELHTGGYCTGKSGRREGNRCPAPLCSVVRRSSFTSSVQKMAVNVDEFAVAGGVLGMALNVVKAKTVDLVVPAEAEIIIEGW